MSKSSRRLDPSQISFFEADQPDLREEAVRKLLTRAINRSGLSRDQIAEFLGVSKSVLDAFTAESKPRYRFPVSFLVRFCRVCGDHELVLEINAALGIPVFRDPSDAVYAELGRAQVEKEEATWREEELKRRLRKRLK